MCPCIMPDSSFSKRITDYEEKTLIGNGSFGHVYKYFSLSNKRFCAIKKIPKKSFKKGSPPPNLSKVYSEISVHSNLNHENIVQFYEWFDDSDYVYLVLELCSYGSLYHLVKRLNDSRLNSSFHVNEVAKQKFTQPLLTYPQIRSIVKQICHGLKYLHKNGIVHRDLNLNNILISHMNDQNTSDIKIKIADFGLAFNQAASMDHFSKNFELPIGNTICGTPGFISPEVLQQTCQVSTASDLFSLGSIIYSLVTGIVPNGELDLSKICLAIADLIERLLAFDPKKRISLEKVLTHPFVTGTLSSKRLSPISKESKNIIFNLTSTGIEVFFKNNNSSIRIFKDINKIEILGKNGKPCQCQLENLSLSQWKKYLYAWRYVDLIKSKTPKIVIYCKAKSRSKMNDSNSKKNLILKCSLMENGNFEVTLFDELKGSIYKMNIISFQQIEDNNSLNLEIKNLYNHCLFLEDSLESLERSSGISSFPLTIGSKLKIHSKSDANTFQNNAIDMFSLSSNNFSRSVCINGVGMAYQSNNGIITLSFEDGSSLSISSTSNIFFSPRPGVKQIFGKKDPLPEIVLNKLQYIPTAIDKLRKQSSFSFTQK